uniref:UL70A n=1 Tax=Panine betaherpesvirus 2 TaxID=188763 RepID=A0A8F7K7P6_9BETA|nr:UL70A [Panine betaherpesvirus 2]
MHGLAAGGAGVRGRQRRAQSLPLPDRAAAHPPVGADRQPGRGRDAAPVQPPVPHGHLAGARRRGARVQAPGLLPPRGGAAAPEPGFPVPHVTVVVHQHLRPHGGPGAAEHGLLPVRGPVQHRAHRGGVRAQLLRGRPGPRHPHARLHERVRAPAAGLALSPARAAVRRLRRGAQPPRPGGAHARRRADQHLPRARAAARHGLRALRLPGLPHGAGASAPAGVPARGGLRRDGAGRAAVHARTVILGPPPGRRPHPGHGALLLAGQLSPRLRGDAPAAPGLSPPASPRVLSAPFASPAAALARAPALSAAPAHVWVRLPYRWSEPHGFLRDVVPATEETGPDQPPVRFRVFLH